MDTDQDESSDVDSAGVYFVTVEEFEQREPIDKTYSSSTSVRSVIRKRA